MRLLLGAEKNLNQIKIWFFSIIFKDDLKNFLHCIKVCTYYSQGCSCLKAPSGPGPHPLFSQIKVKYFRPHSSLGDNGLNFQKGTASLIPIVLTYRRIRGIIYLEIFATIKDCSMNNNKIKSVLLEDILYYYIKIRTN